MQRNQSSAENKQTDKHDCSHIVYILFTETRAKVHNIQLSLYCSALEVIAMLSSLPLAQLWNPGDFYPINRPD